MKIYFIYVFFSFQKKVEKKAEKIFGVFTGGIVNSADDTKMILREAFQALELEKKYIDSIIATIEVSSMAL